MMLQNIQNKQKIISMIPDGGNKSLQKNIIKLETMVGI